MAWGSIDVFGLLNITAFTFVQLFGSVSKTRAEKESKKVTKRVSGLTFQLIWYVLYGLISASMFLYFRANQYETSEPQGRFIAIFILYVVNMLLNKAWSPLFFNGSKTIALGVAIGLLGTAIAILTLLSIAPITWWIPTLFSPYVAWLIIALILNIMAVNKENRKVAKENKNYVRF